MRSLGGRLVQVVIVGLFWCLSCSVASPQQGKDALQEHGLAPLLDTLKETYTNVYNPGRSEAARYLNNAIREAEFSRVFKKGETVDAYVVHDKEDFIEGIYPFHPDLIHSGDTEITKVSLTGSGDWYRPVATSIEPRPANRNDAQMMKNWDGFIDQAANGHLSAGQLEAYGRAGASLRDTPSPQELHVSGPLPKGVRIYFDDRVLARVLGKLGNEATLVALNNLGQALLESQNEDQFGQAFHSFVHQQKAKFVQERPRIRLARPILVSLGNVLSNLKSAHGDFGSIGTEARTLGGITRVHGYVWNKESDDIVLVGSVDEGVEPIGLDNLMVAIRSVWKQGAVPEVSLDPDPSDPDTGPNRTRVLGIPFETRFARVMLDADYLMKKLVDGKEPVGVSEFRPLSLILFDDLTGLKFSRFWFLPQPPSEGDIQVSSDEDVVLFDTGVVLRTEAIRLASDGVIGLGSVEPAAEDVTRQFNAHYEEIEKGRPLLRQLHGLFDLVLLCKIWREMGVQSKDLDGLAKAPVPHQEVPATYPNISFVFQTRNHGIHTLSGGVSTRGGFGVRHELHYDDITFERLRMLARQLSAQNAVARSVPNLALDVFRSPNEANNLLSEAEKAYEEGMSFCPRRDPEDAIKAFDRAIALDAGFVEAYAARAVARWHAHDAKGANGDLARAMSLDPQNQHLRTKALELFLAMGQDPGVIGQLDQTTKSGVAVVYYEEASARWSYGKDASGAIDAVSISIQMNPRDARAYELRALLRLVVQDDHGAVADSTEALRLESASSYAYNLRGLARMELNDEEGAYDDFTEAIKLNPVDPSNYSNRALILKKWGSTDASEKDMAMSRSLEVDRYTRLIQREPDNVLLYIQRGMKKRDVFMTDSSIDDFTEAISKDPRNALAYILRAQTLHTLERYGDALTDSSRAIELDPDYAEAYATRGAAKLKLRQPDEAISDCTVAISKDPKLAYGYHIRGLAKLEKHDFEGAIKDWEIAAKLTPDDKQAYDRLIEDAKRNIGRK